MAIIKCKMCGGDLNLQEGQSVCECEYCGSRQTVPAAGNEKKLTLFARANRLRQNCDFDKAAGIYESIVADFPAESEAYWGLVLCKYGIEYVDDPGTGKKIPTCHRSSYDSVMDDGNFEQAMENADVVAQKVYREEAKHFERLRKGILEVSSTEKPYDIFICYKETDENGNRTVDSLLAQDLYMALTDRGYRVFFSRITLKGKLGEAYEPYIFAALNSAKVMLAVGTCYEYFNAVWVKNEWSRYLKICQEDRSKHLIPCFKNLDPEDMPKEFNHLQGADLGQMGAIQDILINMEKYIPLQKNTNVIQHQVVGGTTGNKIAAALERGNMALEDGEWDKADSFFEDVLSNDARNAQAYIGKTLAQEKCRTLDAFIRKRLDICGKAKAMTVEQPAKTDHIQQMAERYTLPGYVEAEQIRKLYTFDLSYQSEVIDRAYFLQSEEKYWANHKLLTRAEQFATGETAKVLKNEKNRLFDLLTSYQKKAEQEEDKKAAALLARYDAFLSETDEKAKALYDRGCARREADYEEKLRTAKNTEEPDVLDQCGKFFENLGTFRDSKALAAHCRTRAGEIRAEQQRLKAAQEEERRRLEAEEQARLAAEEEKRIIAERKRQREAAARRKKKAAIICAIAVVLLAAFLVVTKVVIPGAKYSSAEGMLADGEYEEAEAAFRALGNYKDAKQAANYAQALEILAAARNREGVADWLNTLTIRVPKGEDAVEVMTEAVEIPAEDQLDPQMVRDTFHVLKNEWRFSASDIKELLSKESSKAECLDAILTWDVTTPECVEKIAWLYVEFNGDADAALKGPDPVVVMELDLTLPKEDREVLALYGYVQEQLLAMAGYRDSDTLCAEIDQEMQAVKSDFYNGIFAQGEAYLAAGEYDKAIFVFEALEGYLDTGTGMEDIYAKAADMEAQGKYLEASAIYTVLGDYQDAKDRRLACGYANAEKLLSEGKNAESAEAFQALGDYSDAKTRFQEIGYNQAEKLLAEKKYDEAAEQFRNLGSYSDSAARVKEVLYAKGEALLSAGSYAEAIEVFTQLGSYSDSADKVAQAKWSIVKNAKVGETVFFGRYEQDGDKSNGGEEIEWLVMDKNGSQMVLMTKDIMETMAFDKNKSNNWNNSSVKKWLNEDFLSAAFTENEKGKIQTTGAGTVYLLSIEEIERYCNVDADKDFATLSYQYWAKLNAHSGGGSYTGDKWWWWTRTSDGYHNQANCVRYVSETGYLTSGNDAAWTGGGVRPVITINING